MNESPDPNPADLKHTGLPEIEITEILGLVELLRGKGGRADIYKLANELNMEFGDMLTVVSAAELLKLVHTPGGDVQIQPLGEKISRAKINERKKIIKTQIQTIPVYQQLCQYLKAKEDHEATRDEVIEKLAELIPNENTEKTFSNLLKWGRYAELFGYSDDDHMFYLDVGQFDEEE